jgi:hopanoid biosynthesis associated protein HpnK
VNEAVALAHRQGVLSAASLMVAGPAAAQAIAIAKRLPGLRVGLHLVLVDGPASLAPEQIPGLAGADGALRGDMIPLAFALALRPAARRQLRAEIEAQFAAFARTGLALDHVNGHKHFHLHPLIARAFLPIGLDYGMAALRVPSEPYSVLAQAEPGSRPALSMLAPWVRRLAARARAAGLTVPDQVFGLRWSGRMTKARLLSLLRRLPPGLTEIYMHPASRDAFTGAAPGYGYSDELAALLDPEVRQAAAQSGRRLGGYADMGARN